MRQALHILRKDVRHFWPYVVAMFIAVAVVAMIYPRIWLPGADYLEHGRILGITIRTDQVLVLPVLVIWLMLTRLLQEEPLVGDQHFWLTRPYRWQQLLLARLLFHVLFIAMPVIAMQMVLLHRAELPALSSLPLLCVNVAVLSLFLLPFAVIAVVTRTFVQALFSLIGIILYAAMLVSLESSIDEYNPGLLGISGGVLVIVMAFVIILVQFATRRVRWSRAALGVVLLVPIIEFLPLGRFTVPLHIPEQHEVSLTLNQDENDKRDGQIEPDAKIVTMMMPLRTTKHPRDHRYTLQAAHLVIVRNGHALWNSRWTKGASYEKWNHQQLLTGENLLIPFDIPRGVYD